MITLKNLSYRFPSWGVVALDDVSADIPTGIHLLLGENGAGKTTLLHIIAGLRTAAPTESCTIDGIPTALRDPQLLADTFIFTDEMKFPFPTINEMVQRHACFYPSFDYDMLQANLARFGMDGSEALDKFSLGNRKKAQLAYILSLRSRILLLDEPANALDISAKQTLLQMLAQCTDEGQTVIISTHTVWDFQNLFESVIVLNHGKLVLNKPIWEITERVSFVSDSMPIPNAIYIEPLLGKYLAITPNTGNTTDVDYTLLYNALQSPSRDNLLNILNSDQQ